jgi:hypothetical protein
MHALLPNELLEVWERGASLSATERALLILATAYTELTPGQIAELSVGQRDRQLLALREQTFGPRLDCVATCPSCAVQLEFRVNAGDICSALPKEPDGSLEVTHADYFVEFRLPNSLDLARLDPAADLETNRERLLEHCVIAARCAKTEVTTTEIPAAVSTVIAERMAAADPQADVQLALDCPHCQHTWQTPFDIVSYLWSEIQAWATRLLREVHSLASAYGWREAEVLALSPWRRQAYLELIGL